MSQFAPFGTLFRYFALRFAGWVCLCLFGLVSIISLIQTIELVRRVSVLTRTVPDINYVGMAALNIPNVMHMILPFAVLTGAMLCFSSWNRSNEFVAVRGFGQSIWAALGPALFASFMVGMGFITVINPIGAVTSLAYEAKMAEIFGTDKNDLAVSESGIWIRDNLPDSRLIFRGETLDADTSRLLNPIIYEFNETSNLRRVIKADSSQLTKNGWMVENAVSWRNNGSERILGNIILPTGLGALNLQRSSLSPRALSIFQLPDFILSLEHAGIPATAHRMHLYQLLALPLMMIGITMLAARATLTNSLRGSRSRLFIRGVMLATIIFIFTYFMQVMGASLRVPTIVAAWTPAFAVFLIGAIILARGDEAKSIISLDPAMPIWGSQKGFCPVIYRLLIQTCIFGLILISALIQPSYAAIEIVAKVNGQPITNYDLKQRVNFLAAVTNIKLNDSNRQRIETDALQMLIDEKLKLAAAQEIDPNIAARSLAMARDLVDSSFQQNGKNGLEVLRELQLDTASIQQKFVTDLAWASFIQAKFNNKLGDINAKIDAELAQILEDATKPQIRVSELILVPEPSRPLQETLGLANEIVAAVGQGANFNAIAQQYSVAGSAKNGGRLGWLSTNQLPENVSNALAKIDIGAVTPPLQQDGAILLFQKNGERKNGQADPSQDRVWLTRALLPLASGAANADRLEAAARLERDTAGISNCPDLLTLHDSYGSNMQGRLDNIIIGSLAPQMLNLVSELQPGVASTPLSFSEGVAVFMLCKREKATIDLPSREDVERGIVEKLFGSLGERYLLRLRRAAAIERR